MRVSRRAPAWLALCLLVLSSAGCVLVSIPHEGRPAGGYVYASGEPLRVSVVDETGGADWAPAIARGVASYAQGEPRLAFQRGGQDAHIAVTLRRYRDDVPPALDGYAFQPGVGGFAAVYDAQGEACNFPPSSLPVGCSGEIARAIIYLNDAIPEGPDIEARRDRLVLHELGHALGLTRHSPELAIEDLDRRYGWESASR